MAGFNYAVKERYFVVDGSLFCFLIVNGIGSAKMICGLRNFKIKLLNEFLYSHPNNNYKKTNICVTLTIEIIFFLAKEISQTCIVLKIILKLKSILKGFWEMFL